MKEFAEVVPDLGNVTEFLRSHRVDAFFDNVLQNKEVATSYHVHVAPHRHAPGGGHLTKR